MLKDVKKYGQWFRNKLKKRISVKQLEYQQLDILENGVRRRNSNRLIAVVVLQVDNKKKKKCEWNKYLARVKLYWVSGH